MIEEIAQCHICKDWFDEQVLLKPRVSEPGGFTRKSVCKFCMKKIENASARHEEKVAPEEIKAKPQILTEEGA